MLLYGRSLTPNVRKHIFSDFCSVYVCLFLLLLVFNNSKLYLACQNIRLCFLCRGLCFVAESSTLVDVPHRMSAFRCDTTVDVDQVRSLMSRVCISAFCWSPILQNILVVVTVCLKKFAAHEQTRTTCYRLVCNFLLSSKVARQKPASKLIVSHQPNELRYLTVIVIVVCYIVGSLFCVCRISTAWWTPLRMLSTSYVVHMSIQLSSLSNTSLLNRYGNGSLLHTCLIYSWYRL